MKKSLLIIALAFIAVFTASQAFAQFGYNFSKLNQPYTPLTASISANKGKLWTSDSVFNIPIGFNFKMAGATISNFYFSGGNYMLPNINTAKQNGFVMLGTGLTDRGQNQMSSRSEIRYLTTGVAGSRIFKLEVSNAGFDDEYFSTGELKDSISLQLWLYEGSNAIEFHYGSSMVSNFNDYFGGIMRSGFVKNLDTMSGTFEKFYVVHETTSATVIDSITSMTAMKGVKSVPASGTVFRFGPKSGPTSVQTLAAGSLAKVYPTQSNGVINIEHNGSHSLSYAVISIQGQVLTQGQAAAGTTAINLSTLPSGTYLIRIDDQTTNSCETQKFIRL